VTLSAGVAGVQVGRRGRGEGEEPTISQPQSVIQPTPPRALDLIRRLASHNSNAEIATEVNAGEIGHQPLEHADGRVGADAALDHHLQPSRVNSSTTFRSRSMRPSAI
jgi:hypothetical protein